jgi:hypothetical protein
MLNTINMCKIGTQVEICNKPLFEYYKLINTLQK